MNHIFRKDELHYSMSREELETMLKESYNIREDEIKKKLDQIRDLPLRVFATVDHISWVPIDTDKDKVEFAELLFWKLEDNEAVAVAKEEKENSVVFVVSDHKRIFVSYYDGDVNFEYGVMELTETSEKDNEDLN
jgi:hypothetical protein